MKNFWFKDKPIKYNLNKIWKMKMNNTNKTLKLMKIWQLSYRMNRMLVNWPWNT